MPATDCPNSSAFANLGRSILSFRRDQVHSMEPPPQEASAAGDTELEAFQRKVAERFLDLSSPEAGDQLLSLSWLRKLLDVFLWCQGDFRVVLLNHRGAVARAPMDRLVGELFERSLKALDVCNAIRDGIQQVRQWQKLLEIVACALNGREGVGEGQFRRARKALADLSVAMLGDRDPSAGPAISQQNRSFGRSKDRRSSSGHSRSLSWSVSRSWSAARQIQAIGSNLAPPRPAEIGLAPAVFTMNAVLLFVMWALVAAVPCQDRGGLQSHLSVPRQFGWVAPMLSLHERISEESRKRDRRSSPGLLAEIHRVERFGRRMNEVADRVCFPLTGEEEKEVRRGGEEAARILKAMEEGLGPLERQVRDVFHRIVRSRTEGMDSFLRMVDGED